MREPTPVSQSFLIEIMAQMEARVDESHGRVRQSLNELKEETRLGFLRVVAKQDEQAQRLASHSEKLLVLKTEREAEKLILATRKQDQRDRTVLITSLTSILVTAGIFVIKALLHL